MVPIECSLPLNLNSFVVDVGNIHCRDVAYSTPCRKKRQGISSIFENVEHRPKIPFSFPALALLYVLMNLCSFH